MASWVLTWRGFILEVGRHVSGGEGAGDRRLPLSRDSDAGVEGPSVKRKGFEL